MGRHDTLQESNHRLPQVLEHHSLLPRHKHLDFPVPEARDNVRVENYPEVVESTYKGEPKDLLKNARMEPQSSMNVREKADIRRMMEEVLQQRKLVPVEDE